MMLVLLLVALAQAARLEQVRVFPGAGHARVLLVLDGAPQGIDSTDVPPQEGVQARGVVTLRDVTAGEGILSRMEIGAAGVVRVDLLPKDGGLAVEVVLDETRIVNARSLDDKAVVVDLRVDGAPPDGTLPTDAQLQAWMEGVNLVRSAGGPPRTRRLVVVDAGHGGWDHGAFGLTGTREADVALEIARRVGQALEERLDVEVILTRTDDTFVTLQERARIANAANADLFLSIHANAAPGPTAWGVETYSLDTASDDGAARVAARENAIAHERGEDMSLSTRLFVSGTNRMSRELAAEVQSGVVAALREAYGTGATRDLGTKTALFYVLVSTRMPSILFEASFLTHPQDERLLRAPHAQETIALAIVDAVGRWLERQG